VKDQIRVVAVWATEIAASTEQGGCNSSGEIDQRGLYPAFDVHSRSLARSKR
jgi:hypothetical protein